MRPALPAGVAGLDGRGVRTPLRVDRSAARRSRALRDRGFEVVALTPDPTSDDIGELAYGPGDRVALVLGAEGPGLSDDTLAAADRRVRIPLHGAVDSLNVASAAAIACYVLGRS